MAKKQGKIKGKPNQGVSNDVLENPIAYTITDKAFGDFKVLNSANAWWLDRIKVNNIISVFKLDATIEEACSYAGITKAQYNYFIEKHPNFSDVIEACRELPNLKARQTLVNNLDKAEIAIKYLEKKKRKEFGNAIDITSGNRAIKGFNYLTPEQDAADNTNDTPDKKAA